MLVKLLVDQDFTTETELAIQKAIAAVTTSTSFSVQYHRQSAYSLFCIQNKKGLAFGAWFFLGG